MNRVTLVRILGSTLRYRVYIIDDILAHLTDFLFTVDKLLSIYDHLRSFDAIRKNIAYKKQKQ